MVIIKPQVGVYKTIGVQEFPYFHCIAVILLVYACMMIDPCSRCTDSNNVKFPTRQTTESSEKGQTPTILNYTVWKAISLCCFMSSI